MKVGFANNYKSPRPYIYFIMTCIFIALGVIYLKQFEQIFNHISMTVQWSVWIGYVSLAFLFCVVMGCMRNKVFKGNNVKYLGKHHDSIFLLSHGTMHFLLGAFAPALWPFSLAAGFAWEFFECYSFDWSKVCDAILCGGDNDILVNTFGLASGVFASTLVKHADIK